MVVSPKSAPPSIARKAAPMCSPRARCSGRTAWMSTPPSTRPRTTCSRKWASSRRRPSQASRSNRPAPPNRRGRRSQPPRTGAGWRNGRIQRLGEHRSERDDHQLLLGPRRQRVHGRNGHHADAHAHLHRAGRLQRDPEGDRQRRPGRNDLAHGHRQQLDHGDPRGLPEPGGDRAERDVRRLRLDRRRRPDHRLQVGPRTAAANSRPTRAQRRRSRRASRPPARTP